MEDTHLRRAVKITDSNFKWIHRYNNGHEDYGCSVEIDKKGNIIAVGNSFDGKKYTTEIRKFDGNGNLIWNNTYKSAKQNMVYDLAIGPNNCIIITGLNGEWTNDALPNSSAYLVKYDEDGKLLWNKFFKQGICTIGFGVKTDSKENIYLTSTLFKKGEPNLTCWIIKCDKDGNKIWDKFYHEQYMNIPYGLAVDSKDSVIVVGYAFNPYKINGIWTAGFMILKYDKNGKLLWSKRYLPRETAEALDIYVDSQDNIIIVGKNSFVDKKYNDIIIVKIDKIGNILWENKHRNNFRFYPFGLGILANGEIIIGGSSHISKYPTSFIGAFSKEGELKWIKRTNDKKTIFDIAVDKNNSVISVGSFFDKNQEFYILKEIVD